MTHEDIRKKYSHTQSPLLKLKDKLEEKRKSGTITPSEKIKLNNINMQFLKDMIIINKTDVAFSESVLSEIFKIKKENEKLQKKITLEKNKKPRVKRLRRGPRK